MSLVLRLILQQWEPLGRMQLGQHLGVGGAVLLALQDGGRVQDVGAEDFSLLCPKSKRDATLPQKQVPSLFTPCGVKSFWGPGFCSQRTKNTPAVVFLLGGNEARTCSTGGEGQGRKLREKEKNWEFVISGNSVSHGARKLCLISVT